jgi:hypothetical protein
VWPAELGREETPPPLPDLGLELAQLGGLPAGHARAGAGLDLMPANPLAHASVVPMPSFWGSERIGAHSKA